MVSGCGDSSVVAFVVSAFVDSSTVTSSVDSFVGKLSSVVDSVDTSVCVTMVSVDTCFAGFVSDICGSCVGSAGDSVEEGSELIIVYSSVGNDSELMIV